MFLHRPTVGYCILSATKTLPRLLIIAGPTASGKSKLALDVADRLNGIVINADSMQVYREMRILTARPSPVPVGSFRCWRPAQPDRRDGGGRPQPG
nr:hypothetical protein [Anaerolineae bacterium]